jgi:hypothetical protein
MVSSAALAKEDRFYLWFQASDGRPSYSKFYAYILESIAKSGELLFPSSPWSVLIALSKMDARTLFGVSRSKTMASEKTGKSICPPRSRLMGGQFPAALLTKVKIKNDRQNVGYGLAFQKQ